MIIQPIRPKRVASEVFEQIRDLIYRGEFRSGEQIPTERDLASSMRVSRTSVRNAIDRLVGMKLLRQVQGKGTFVFTPENRTGNPLAVGVVADSATVFDTLEVHIDLACNAVFLSARRATQNDIQAIGDSLREMEDDLKHHRKISVSSITAFNMAVIFSTKNPVVIHLARNYYDLLYSGIKKTLARLETNSQAYKEMLEQYRNIYCAIKMRDVQAARKAMHDHQRFLQGMLGNDCWLAADASSPY